MGRGKDREGELGFEEVVSALNNIYIYIYSIYGFRPSAMGAEVESQPSKHLQNNFRAIPESPKQFQNNFRIAKTISGLRLF